MARRVRRKRANIFDAMAEVEHVITRLRWGHSLQRVCEDYMLKPDRPRSVGSNAGNVRSGASTPGTRGQRTPVNLVCRTSKETHESDETEVEDLDMLVTSKSALRRAAPRRPDDSLQPDQKKRTMVGIDVAAISTRPSAVTLRTSAIGSMGTGKIKDVAAELDKKLKLVQHQSAEDTAKEQRVLQAVTNLTALCLTEPTERVIEPPAGVEQTLAMGGLTAVSAMATGRPTGTLTPQRPGRGRVSSGGEIDYMEGTSLYYGSSVALQNCFHSGYLCMDASRRAKATPHHCRHPNAVMKVWNLEDLTYTGAIRYGDKVWLQLGRHEILGTSPIEPHDRMAEGQKREHERISVDQRDPSDFFFGLPTSINCRKTSLKAARHRGCWVFLNKARPMETLGEEVQHLDEIVLEQEFAYLSSQAPESVELRQVSSFPIFSFDRKGQREGGKGHDNNDSDIGASSSLNANRNLVVYNFNKHFAWRIYLTGLPPDAVLEEERQRLAYEARVQLRWSAGERQSKLQGMQQVRAFRAEVLQRGEAQVHEMRQERKDGVDRILMDKYRATDFNLLGKARPSWLASLYGPDSRWASELRREAVARDDVKTAKTMRHCHDKGTPREGGLLDFRAKGGRLVSGLEEKRTLAEAAKIESKVPIAVWSAILAQQDKDKIKMAIKQAASILTIQRAIRQFRDRKWERKLLKIDPTISQSVAEERARQARSEGQNLIERLQHKDKGHQSPGPEVPLLTARPSTAPRPSSSPLIHQPSMSKTSMAAVQSCSTLRITTQLSSPQASKPRPKSATTLRRPLTATRKPSNNDPTTPTALFLTTRSGMHLSTRRPQSASSSLRRAVGATATIRPPPTTTTTTLRRSKVLPTQTLRLALPPPLTPSSPDRPSVSFKPHVVVLRQDSHGSADHDEEGTVVVAPPAILSRLADIDRGLESVLNSPLHRGLASAQASRRAGEQYRQAAQNKRWQQRKAVLQRERLERQQKKRTDEQQAQPLPQPLPQQQSPSRRSSIKAEAAARRRSSLLLGAA